MEDLKEKETKIVEYVISKFKDNIDSIKVEYSGKPYKDLATWSLKDFNFQICFYLPPDNNVGYILHEEKTKLDLTPPSRVKLLEFSKFVEDTEAYKQRESKINLMYNAIFEK